MEKIKQLVEQVQTEVGQVIIGQEEVIEKILIAVFIGSHVLLEGPPGIAKTLTAKSIAAAISATFKRVQFTPDLMPLDLTGTNIFNLQKQEFVFRSGPVFTDLLLADEINRTPPKTQSALLEAMEEKQITVDGEVHKLSPIFTVLATQNPLEYEGTYPLPEAQLDRFLFKLIVSYPDPAAEIEIYRRYQNGLISQDDLNRIQPVVSLDAIMQVRREIASVGVRPEMIDYIHKIVAATREHPLLTLGASPRAGVNLMLAAKAAAAVQGRDYLIPEDIQDLVYPVFRHRLLIKPEALIDGKSSDSVIKNIMTSLPVPR